MTESSSRHGRFVEMLLQSAPNIAPYESSSSLMEQLIDNIMSDGEVYSKEDIDGLKASLLEDFVDWNEIRLVSPDRLKVYFEGLNEGEYKRKVLQAVLNKIFSRSGSLDYQFMMDFESEDLEGYLAGIMELKEGTRKRLMLRVFRKPVEPVTTDHEIIFEAAQSEHMPGSEEFKAPLFALEINELERILALLDTMVEEHGGITPGEFLSPEDFNSATLNRILALLDKPALS